MTNHKIITLQKTGKGREKASERRGRKQKETMTATRLCRGFNQPNYSLITQTQNLEQLTHTNTHTHVQTLTLVTRFHRRDGSCNVRQITLAASETSL